MQTCISAGVEQEQAGKPLHVFDLPQLYSQPSASSLLSTLSLLAVKPPTWAYTTPSTLGESETESARPRVHPDGLPAYLTRIVASSLGWIEDENDKAAIWETASLRLAERSGRSGVPAIDRSFSLRASDDGEEVTIAIHEPALTADNLGLKTWAASYMLAKRLALFSLPALEKHATGPTSSYQILELGSGTGLVGMAAAALLGTGVLLTDLPDIESNLMRNVRMNQTVLSYRGGFATTAVLDWSKPTMLKPSLTLPGDKELVGDIGDLRGQSRAMHTLPTPPDSIPVTPVVMPKTFPVILAADSIYDPEHPAMLVSTISHWLDRSKDARVVIELPLRDAYLSDVNELKKGMRDTRLVLLDEGEETGIDDWGSDGDDEGRLVKCWWGIWGWDFSSLGGFGPPTPSMMR